MPAHPLSKPSPTPPFWACLLLLTVWLLPGLFGNEPWKPDGAYTFGLINHMAQSGDWVVPTLAGEPFMEKPPLFFITSSLFIHAFGHWLSWPDAARLASVFYDGLAFIALTLSARLLFGTRAALWAPLVLIGCLGFTVRAHQLITDTALFAGISWGLYGLLLAPQRPILAGIVLGLGAAAALLSKGLLGPGILGLSALLLPLVHPGYRQRGYAKTLAIALLVGAPLPLLWMGALYQRSPQLFQQWFFLNNFGRFSGTSHLGPTAEKLFYLKTLPWYAFPALPMALIGLWHERSKAALLQLAAPLILFAVTLAVLSLAADARELYAMPLLAPLCLLAVPCITSTAPISPTGRRIWLGVAAVLLALMLLVAVCLATGVPAALMLRLHKWVAGWQPHWPVKFWVAGLVALTALFWLWNQAPIERAGSHLWRWSLCLTMIWSQASTLWLPALDTAMGYAIPFAGHRIELQQATSQSCIASSGLGEPQRALLEYYAEIRTLRLERDSRALQCRWLLVQSLNGGLPEQIEANKLQPQLSMARPGDTKERLLLYHVPQTLRGLNPAFAPPNDDKQNLPLPR